MNILQTALVIFLVGMLAFGLTGQRSLQSLHLNLFFFFFFIFLTALVFRIALNCKLGNREISFLTGIESSPGGNTPSQRQPLRRRKRQSKSEMVNYLYSNMNVLSHTLINSILHEKTP